MKSLQPLEGLVIASNSGSMGDAFFWVEESNEQLSSLPVKTRKRRSASKKLEFFDWGSRPLIEFLESIGKDISKKYSQYDVTAIINEYVNANNLLNPEKKKRILCDERLHTLFGKKSLPRIKIYDLLEAHFAENHAESDVEIFFSSEEGGATISSKRSEALGIKGKPPQPKKQVLETRKSCYAAVVSENIKHVYLKRSFVQELMKAPESFEEKVVGCFVRIKSDPYDYLQKNKHQLQQVTGVKRTPGANDAEILFKVSSSSRDITINMLSDDNFSEEECDDLCQRVRTCLLKKPTVVELERKAKILHKDITMHWITKELSLLQKLIDRANEKGWRKELFDYLERKQLLETESERQRLLLEIPRVIAEELEPEAAPLNASAEAEEGHSCSPKSILREASGIFSNSAGPKEIAGTSQVIFCGSSFGGEKNGDFLDRDATRENLEDNHKLDDSLKIECSGGVSTEIIDLSSDESEDGHEKGHDLHANVNSTDVIWHYVDPLGVIQGPFSLKSLKRWNDAHYFDADFRVWKTGQTQKEAVLLTDVLRGHFPTE